MNAAPEKTSGDDEPVSEAVNAQAADWLARRAAGFTAEEQRRFSDWLRADPRHAGALRPLEATWRLLRKPSLTGQAELVVAAVEARMRDRGRRNRRRFTAGLFAAAACAVFAFAVLRDPGAADQPLGRVEVKPERRALSDGSVVELKAGADISVDFNAARRAVELIRGEAHFAVAKDATRPFVVTAGAVSVKAVGTEFAVRVAPAAVDVLVTEGRVAVERMLPNPGSSGAVPAPTFLDAGNRTVVSAGAPGHTPLEIQPVAAPEIASALAWRSMRVEFTATPLGEIVERLNRQNRIQLALADPSLDALRISGIFWLDDPDGFARLVETSASLRSTPRADGRIILSRR